MKKISRFIVQPLLCISLILFLSCGKDSSSDKVDMPDEVNLAAQALQDVSPLDLAELGLAAPPEFGSPLVSRMSVGSALASDNLPPADPRWVLMLHPLRPRGKEDQLPRIIEPLIAARYVLSARPSCATVTETGTCPPDPLTQDSTCNSVIAFDSGGCTVSASVSGQQTSIFLSGTLNVAATVTQTGTIPQIKGHTVVQTSDFRVTEPGGAYVDYAGTVLEDFDGTAPNGGFTLVHTSPVNDPITLTGSIGFVLSVTGTRSIAVIPQTSVIINKSGTVYFDTIYTNPIEYDLAVTKTMTAGVSSVNLTLDRTVTLKANGAAFHRTADLTLTPSDNPVTDVVIDGTETFSGPALSVTAAINSVSLDLNCFAPRGGNIVITTPIRVVTVTFDNNCNCFANWSDNLGHSGIFDFCNRQEKN